MKKLLFPILLALLLVTIVSCKKEEKKPTPSDPAKVFLAKEYYIINNDTTATTTYEWDNNHLKRVSKVEDPDINIHIESQSANISGTVKNVAGTAVDGATVTLVSADGDNVQYSGKSDAEGVYSINVIQAGRNYAAIVTAERCSLPSISTTV